MRRSKVKFYNEYDLGAGWNLQKAEEILQAWDCSYNEEDINEILNYYNIKRYFDVNLRLKDWDKSTFTVLKDMLPIGSQPLQKVFGRTRERHRDLPFCEKGG